MSIKPVTLLATLCGILLCGGCTVVSENRVFPKFTWYWSADAKQQRRANEAEKLRHEQLRNQVTPP